VFIIHIRFLAVSWIQGCFHWLSSPICSGVMADQSLTGQYSGRRGVKGVQKIGAHYY